MPATAHSIPATAPTPSSPSPSSPSSSSPTAVAMLLNVFSFEVFFGRVMKVDRDAYLSKYRSDYAWYYAAGLAENGVRPLIYIPSLRHEGRYETDAGVPVRFLKCRPWFAPLQAVRYLARKSRRTLYALEWANTLSFRRRLRAALAADGVDVLYVQEYWTGRFDALAGRVGVPVVGGDHGGQADGVVTTTKRRSFARAAALQCQTRDECDAVRRHGGTPTFLPNGCDRKLFSPDPGAAPARGKTILTVGRLTDVQKRTSDLIRAVAELPADWSLDVIGSGPDRERLGRLAGELGVADRVRFLGFRARTEVRDAIRACGVYAMASSNEGMCLALLEAMSCGAACVMTRIRAFEAVIEDGVNGLLVPVGQPAAIADAVRRAYDRRDQLGANAVATIAHGYDSQIMYRRLAHLVRSAASAGPVAAADPAHAEPREELVRS